MISKISALLSLRSQQGSLWVVLCAKRNALALMILLLFVRCGQETKLTEEKDKLNYERASARSGEFRAEAQLTADTEEQELTLMLKLVNDSRNKVLVNDIIVSTPEGVRSAPIDAMAFHLPAESDTLVELTYNPVNDLVLYQLTGIHGSFKSSYRVSVEYQPENKPEQALALTLRMPESQYAVYERYYKEKISAFVFNTGNDFNQRQSRYLGEVIRDRTPFVYVSEQEIMVSGLNIRLKAWQRNDSLNTSLIFINHAVFPVTIDTARLCLYGNNTLNSPVDPSTKNTNDRNDDLVLLKRGERLSITLSEHVPVADPGGYFISLSKSILIADGKPMFVADVKLIEKIINL